MIVVDALVKEYAGPKKQVIRAVDGVSFTAHPGEIFGLLGPNGAGKTTVLRILATILQPTSGTAIIDGSDIREDPLAVRRKIGFLTGAAGLYDRLTPIQNLTYFGRLHAMPDDLIKRRIDVLVDKLDIGRYASRTCDKLSTGEKQRVAIARAMLHDPRVLYFDEPTSGLDVLAARTVMNFLRECRAEGRTILFSSHIMAEVEALCDSITVIHRGVVTATGTIPELRVRTGATTLEQLFLRCIGEDHDSPMNIPHPKGIAK